MGLYIWNWRGMDGVFLFLGASEHTEALDGYSIYDQNSQLSGQHRTGCLFWGIFSFLFC